MIEVEGPDGTIAEFPDGTPPETITGAMRQRFGGPTTSAEPSLVSRIMGDKVAPGGLTSLVTGVQPQDALSSAAGTAAHGFRGVRRGLANIAGMPVDALNWALGATGLPVSDKPFMGSKAIDEALGLPAEVGAAALNAAGVSVNAEPPPASGMVDRVVNRIGEEVGATAVPVGVALRAGQMGVQAARKLPLLARMFVEPAAINPGAYAGKEAAAAVAAGTGAGLANEVTRAAGADSHGAVHNVGDFAGALTGAGTLAVSQLVSRPVKDILQAIFRRDKFNNQVVQEAATDRLVNASSTLPKTPGEPVDTQPLVDTIMNGRRVGDTIPGFKESVADRTADPGLAAEEYARQSGQNSGMFAQRRAENTAAVDTAMKGSEPQGTPGALRSELSAERDRRLANADTAARTATSEANALASGLQPTTTPQARGSTIRTSVDDALAAFIDQAQRDQAAAAARSAEATRVLTPGSDPAVRGNVVRSALEEERAAARERTSDAYQAANVNDKPVAPAPLSEALDTTNAGLTAVERGLVPQTVIDRVARLGRTAEGAVDTGILDASGNPITRAPAPPDPMRLKEATDLKSELQRLQRAALADPRAENGGRNAARVLGEYIDTVDAFITRNLTEEERQAVTAARGAKVEEADAFARRGDPVADVLARNEGGQPRIRDERVAGQFVNPSTEGPLNRLFTEADTPQVRAAISDEILSRVPRDADAAKLDRFLQDYEIPLRQFPGLRDQITAASAAQRGAETATANVGARRAEFAGDSRAMADTTARRSDGQPALLDEQVPGRFVNQTGNRDLDALLTRADTPEVRRAIEEEITSRASGAMGEGERLRGFVSTYAQPLERFPGLRERLLKAAEARDAARTASEAEAKTTRELGTPDKPGTSTVGQYLRYGDERAREAMKGVMASKEPGKAADELLSFVKDQPAAVEGARKAFWDIMQERARSAGETTKTVDGAQPWMPRRLKAFLDDPAVSAVAERLYRDNPEHLENVRKIADALQGVDIRARAKAPGTSGTTQGMSNILTPETLQSRFYAYKRGQTSLGFMVTALASVMARRAVRGAQGAAIERLLDNALSNPEVAAQLLKDNNPANRAALGRTAKAFLGNEVSTVIDILDGEGGNKDPVKDAAMREPAKPGVMAQTREGLKREQPADDNPFGSTFDERVKGVADMFRGRRK